MLDLINIVTVGWPPLDGKPPLYRIRHLRSVDRLEWVSGESWGSKQSCHVIH